MNGTKSNSSSTTPTVCDKDKKWQNELLMERLKSKSSQHRNFQEMSKAMRMALLEKRYALDHVEKANLQKCLDSMQHCIKVTTRQGLVERLESLTRQLGLKFMEDQSGLFISSDMFYLEIVLDANGVVQDVKVHHEGNVEQQSCKELVSCLVKGDFTDFTQQLEGLASIYQLNAEQKIKSKAFVALQALETDLANMFMFHNVFKDPQVLLLKSAVGILQARRGGHPMKLTFFVSPYDLLDFESKTIQPLTIELINSKNIGISVTVNLEASAANKLQITPILMVNKDQQGRSTPVYTLMGPHNSTMLPASFVLRLNKPLPVAYNLIQQMKQTTELNFAEEPPQPILTLIAQHESNGEINSASRGLFVSLPDQNHCYFITNSTNLNGIVLNSVPFIEPSHVPHILNLLRLQAAFNTLISSCIRIKGKQDIENAIMFEVSAISCQHIIISLEHPFEESMATVEVNLTDLTNITCKIYTLGKTYDQIAIKLSKIVQKCMSIPITMRALVKYWEQEHLKTNLHQQRNLDNGNFNLNMGPNDPGGRNNGNDFNRDIKNNTKTERNGSNGFNGSANNRSIFHQSGPIGVTNPGFSEHMFSSVNENNSLLSQLTSGNSQDSMGFNNELSASSKLNKKRRTIMSEDFWKSPKSNKMDIESSNNASELLLECSNNSSDSNSLGTSTSVPSETGVATPNSNVGFPSDNDTAMEQSSDNTRTMSDDCEMSDSETITPNNKKSSCSKTDSNKLSPTVSLTPIPSSITSVLTGMSLERRPGIEIIPFATTPVQTLPSSITITPINSSTSSSSSSLKSGNEKKSSSSSSSKQRRSSEDKKLEKKKKRKRDDSPMGPPEKLPLKQDPLTKPVTVSIKTTDGSPVSPTGLLKKFSSSPGSKSSSSSKHSPRNSPIYHGSPKHAGLSPKSSSMSPKHHTSSGSGKPSMSQLKSATNSPSSKSSEKSSKSSSRDSKERSDRDKKSSSSGSSSPKLKQTSVKLNKLDLNLLASIDLITTGGVSGGDTSNTTSPTDLNKSLANNQARNRKGSLSAVIDKLKSAQHVTEDISSTTNTTTTTSASLKVTNASSSNNSSSTKEKSSNVSNSVSSKQDLKSVSGSSRNVSSSTSSSSSKSSEYMVKPSSDGIKLTINKTRAKDSSSNKDSSSKNISGSGSPLSKSQSGLKPGVNSGPASKKFSSSGSALPIKSSLQKSNSSGNLSATLSSKSLSNKSSLPKTLSSGSLSSIGVDSGSKKDKSKQSSKLVSNNDRHHYRTENDVMKLLGFTQSSQTMEGFMKTLDTKKFQIPKLSARTSVGGTSGSSGNINSINNNNIQDDIKKDTKIFTSDSNSTSSNDTTAKMLADLLSKETPQKYPFSVNKSNDSSVTTTSTTGTTNTQISHSYNSVSTDLSMSKDYDSKKSNISLPQSGIQITTVSSPFPSPVGNSLDFSSSLSESPKLLNNILVNKDHDTTASKLMRPPSAPPTSNLTVTKQSLDDKNLLNEVLDFSSTTSLSATKENISSVKVMPSPTALRKSTSPIISQQKGMFPASPSVSVHIVKSPVPSPLMVIPSPHSNSPCITDDELMDEALVGISGK